MIGIDSCYQEGCYLSLVSEFQEGFESKKKFVFLEPYFISEDLDVSLWKVSLVKDRQKTSYKSPYVLIFLMKTHFI